MLSCFLYSRLTSAVTACFNYKDARMIIEKSKNFFMKCWSLRLLNL